MRSCQQEKEVGVEISYSYRQAGNYSTRRLSGLLFVRCPHLAGRCKSLAKRGLSSMALKQGGDKIPGDVNPAVKELAQVFIRNWCLKAIEKSKAKEAKTKALGSGPFNFSLISGFTDMAGHGSMFTGRIGSWMDILVFG